MKALPKSYSNNCNRMQTPKIKVTELDSLFCLQNTTTHTKSSPNCNKEEIPTYSQEKHGTMTNKPEENEEVNMN
jgi:hypothetical protein